MREPSKEVSCATGPPYNKAAEFTGAGVCRSACNQLLRDAEKAASADQTAVCAAKNKLPKQV
jgi:hypothetical protein